MSFVEIEVKFHVADIRRMRERLASIGAVAGTRAEETNIRFEDEQNGLYRHHALLRLRKADKNTLTYKSKPAENACPCDDQTGSSDFKIQNEFEVVVDDFEGMHRILRALGFHAEQIYEKVRETWTLEQTFICLDEMPFGIFMEIEGTPEAIRKTTGLLDLKWPERILYNYLEMFEIIKRGERLAFTDVTFENFNGILVDLVGYLPLFYADRSILMKG
jgi:adenylate cyclase, class 2